LACERMCRDTIAERFPGHDVLAEELGAAAAGRSPSRFRWVFDPLDGTANYDPTRKELFTAERGEGSYLNGRALRVSSTSTLIDSLLVTGFPYTVHEQ